MTETKLQNNSFKNKTIIILSPQPWEGLLISKHHYAKTLAISNKVFFISAPGFGKKNKITVPEKGLTLFVLNYNLLLPRIIKFHARSVYQFYVKKKLISLLKKLTTTIDLCIDFGCYQQYTNLDWIESEVKIFFPVDDSEFLMPVSRGADFVISVSKIICNKYNVAGKKCYFINHGLAPSFEKIGRQKIKNLFEWKKNKKIRVGYSGNLFIPFIDIDVFQMLITQNPDIEFHFFGKTTYDSSQENMIAWNEFLHKAPNVKLNGILSSEELSIAYCNIDAFILCYKPDYKNYHCENSHKIFEYLSTGMIIISTYLSLYEGTELFEMAPKDKNEEILSIFTNAVNRLKKFNSLELQQRRIQMTLNNTYEKQVERINELIKSES